MARRRTRSPEPKPTKEQIRKQEKEEGKKISSFLKRNPWVLFGVLAIVIVCAIFYGIPLGQETSTPTATPTVTRATDKGPSVTPAPENELTVHMIDVGQGDATLIRQGDAAMLIERLLAEYLPRSCVLDLGGLSFMDSSGIALILRVHRRMVGSGGRVWIEQAKGQPLRVLDAGGVERIVRIVMPKEAKRA